MRIVVTGALGHIGSRLIRSLAEGYPGAEIIMIDNLFTQRLYSLFNLPDTASYRFIQGDVTRMDIDAHLAGVDAVVHLAALTDATRSFEHPEEMEQVNLAATEWVATACRAAAVRLIHLSSTSVYGTDKEQVDEFCGDEDVNPQSPYAQTKLQEEKLIGDMCKDGSLKALSLRFGTIFGVSPGMRFHTVVNKFCWQAVMRQPLSVWKTALDQKRPYLDLGDAVRAIVHVLNNGVYEGGVYNAVSVNITVRQVIDSIRRLVPGLEINLVDSPIMNQLSFKVMNSRLEAESFVPQGSLDAAVEETVSMLRNANSF
jgi:nucleoside-diphosphate-sugar epimerase